ncbi:MAG TPA: lipopolysaccharide assembly protein LapA domain-containing protein [Stellaceae bacterium]|nr:lipopolysaccharide assembly protein LapA domain-containing protein [Stellaceae bacterium]
MKLLFWIVVIIAAAVLGSFAASNRESVTLGLWPLPTVASLPLYIAVLGALAVGAVLGALATWLGGGKRRREARRRIRRIAALERELAAQQPPAAAAAARPPLLAAHN